MMQQQSLGELLSQVLTLAPDECREAQLARDAQSHAAWELSRQIAPLLEASAAEVFDALTFVPDAMLPLLETPQGWRALAAHIAPDFALPPPRFSPSVH